MTINNEAVKTLALGSISDCIPILSEFNTQFEKQTQFPQVDDTIKTDLWTVIFTRIQSPATPPEFIRLLLSTLRILSRERSTLESIMTEERAKIVLQVAGLKESSHYENNSDVETLEGLKVVYNMLFQSSSVRKVFVDNELLQGLVTKVKHFPTSESRSSPDVKIFTLRILFIITALSRDTPAKILHDVKGVIYIVEFLENLSQGKQNYDDMTVDLICEILKVLYNLFSELPVRQNSSEGSSSSDDEDHGHLIKITQLIRLILQQDTKTSSKKEELQNHSVNLLTVVPNVCFEELIPETIGETSNSPEGKELSAIDAILDFLKKRIFLSDGNRTLSELLSPVLKVMICMSGANMIIRKYLKEQVLPPLKKQDVVEKPEVGNTLRNKLCALLTSPAGNIAELVANFLFILCNENVKKLIKYTGYGNAAGLLANKGLLLGGRVSSECCSSDSDSSDTEEYREVRHLVNEVEGWIQPERPHGCEGMTDEQKEYEAMKLVEAIEMLNMSNVITPCRIGPDGRPQPLNHVLQLQESIEPPFNDEGNNNSDND